MGEDSYERRSRSLADLVEQHERDLYRGNGQPGLTTRMKEAENRVKILEDYNKNRDKNHNDKLNLLIGAAFTALAGIIVTLVLTVMRLK